MVNDDAEDRAKRLIVHSQQSMYLWSFFLDANRHKAGAATSSCLAKAETVG